MRLVLRIVALVPAVLCWPALADLVPVVNISVSADFPSSGVQEIDITNETGMVNGCNSYYLVCNAVAFQNWTLTVSYASTYYNNSGPALANPFVLQSQGLGSSIFPAAPLAVDFDRCGSNPVPNCASPSTVISQITFSGTLNQNNLTLFDPTANGGTGGPGPTFFSNPVFTATFIPSSGFPSDYFESQDGFVSSQSTMAPEPQYSLAILSILVPIVWVRRSRRRP